MITLPISILKAAMLFVSTEQTRYYLNGVHMLRRGEHLRIAATDGHRLFCASQDLDAPGPDFDVIIPRDGLKKALTGLDRRQTQLDMALEWGERAGVDSVLSLTLGDVKMLPVDGTFPDITRVIPGDISGETAQFNPEYLADLGKAAKILGGSASGLRVSHNGDAPALITFGGTRLAFAVLMPYRCQTAEIERAEISDILGRDPGTGTKAA